MSLSLLRFCDVCSPTKHHSYNYIAYYFTLILTSSHVHWTTLWHHSYLSPPLSKWVTFFVDPSWLHHSSPYSILGQPGPPMNPSTSQYVICVFFLGVSSPSLSVCDIIKSTRTSFSEKEVRVDLMISHIMYHNKHWTERFQDSWEDLVDQGQTIQITYYNLTFNNSICQFDSKYTGGLVVGISDDTIKVTNYWHSPRTTCQCTINLWVFLPPSMILKLVTRTLFALALHRICHERPTFHN